MTRMDRIATLTAKLRDLCEQNADRRMAEHFGIKVEDLDEYDSRIGTSIRDLADRNMEKWGVVNIPPVIDLGRYRRQRETQSRGLPVRVLRETDPENANRSYYFVLGEDVAAVQNAIDGLIAEVEAFGSGYGDFTKPRKHDGLYFAFGEVVVRPDPYDAHWTMTEYDS